MKQFFISAVGAILQLGKKGNTLKNTATGIGVYDVTGTILANLQTASPLTGNDVVTLSYLQTFISPDYIVYGEMWITGIGAENINVTGATAVDGKIYIVTYVQSTATTSFIKNDLYRYDEDTLSYIAVTFEDGTKISSANVLEDGYDQAVLDGDEVNAIKLKNATLYIYEETGNIWYESVRPNLSGYHVTKSFTMSYTDVSAPLVPTLTGLVIPQNAKVKEIIIDVTTAFTTDNGLDPVDVHLGVTGALTRFLDGDESDLSEIDFNIHRVKYLTTGIAADTELELTFDTTDTALTAGSVTIYVEYILE